MRKNDIIKWGAGDEQHPGKTELKNDRFSFPARAEKKKKDDTAGEKKKRDRRPTRGPG